jgi:hypothetical protein
MGRVVRGMGATGWEGTSDMAAACAGAIGRLGVSVDGDRSAEVRAGGGVDSAVEQRSLTSAAGTWQQLRPRVARAQKVATVVEDAAALPFSLNKTPKCGKHYGAQKNSMLCRGSPSIC